jgi:CRISPR-associated protein Csm2
MVDVTFYKNAQTRTIRPELFSDTAEELAKAFSSENERINKRTQIRKFYDEVVRLNTLAKQTKDEAGWEDILPYLNMLIAKAAYAQGRKLVTEDFVSFIRISITQVTERKDLDVFASFFEAFMAFYRKYRPAN